MLMQRFPMRCSAPFAPAEFGGSLPSGCRLPPFLLRPRIYERTTLGLARRNGSAALDKGIFDAHGSPAHQRRDNALSEGLSRRPWQSYRRRHFPEYAAAAQG